MFCYEDVFQPNVIGAALMRHVHIAVKCFQQFAVNVVKVFAHDDSHRVCPCSDHVHNLTVHFIPQQLGGAPQQGHVNLKMNVADFYEICFFIV